MLSVKFKQEELVKLSTLEEKRNSKKKGGGLDAAVSSTEKIRTWLEHTLSTEELASFLEVELHEKPGDPNFFGLTED